MKEIIREIRINDVENFNKLLDSVINQSEYLLFNPGEHQISIQNQTLFLEEMITTSNSTIIVAELNDTLIGYVTIQGGKTNRNRHAAKLLWVYFRHLEIKELDLNYFKKPKLGQ